MKLNNLINDFGDGSNVYFTSDTHFGHKSIIECTHRPFSNTTEMDAAIIALWNETVGPNDIIFHLGDFCWNGAQKWVEILKQLNGVKYLIVGNHDVKRLKGNVLQYFEDIKYQTTLLIDDWHLYLNHYPFLCFGGTYRKGAKVAQAFGHVHYEKLSQGLDVDRLNYLFPAQYDVGVDNNYFCPISWKELKDKFEKQINANCNMRHYKPLEFE